jgi:hypothetical protein
MYYGKLQPKRSTLAVRVLLVCVGVLGLAATAGFVGMAGSGAVQAAADTPPPSNKEKPQIPPSSSGQTHLRSPLGMSGKGKESAKAAQAGSAKATTPTAAGRRDPFKAWVAPTPPSRLLLEPGALPPGTRGLVISGLRLEGTVRDQAANTMIAVVTNYTKRAYFLRVNDAVYNGVVSKITPEAIYFKENTLDSRGRVTTHEVEIKLGSAPGEGR